MELDIKAAIASAKSQNRPLSDAEMPYLKSYLEQRSIQLEAAAYLSENIPHLSKATAQGIFAQQVSMNEEEKKGVQKIIELILHYLTYCLGTGNTEVLDEYLITGLELEEITYTFNLSFIPAIEALNYIKANHGLTKQAAVEINNYIEHALELVKNRQKIISSSSNNEADVDDLFEPSASTFWERIVEIGAQVPGEEWDKLPRDFARNFEHYMYGAPKEE